MQQDEAGPKSFQGVQVVIKNGTKTMAGWWFGTFFFRILGIIIPTDFHIFQRVLNHQPDEKNEKTDYSNAVIVGC